MMLLEEAQVTGVGFVKKAKQEGKTKERKKTLMLFDNPMPAAGKKKKKKKRRKSSVYKQLKDRGAKVQEADLSNVCEFIDLRRTEFLPFLTMLHPSGPKFFEK